MNDTMHNDIAVVLPALPGKMSTSLKIAAVAYTYNFTSGE